MGERAEDGSRREPRRCAVCGREFEDEHELREHVESIGIVH